MHTPGPWRRVRVETAAYYTHQIEVAAGHIASVAGWTAIGTTCPKTEANARLIEHAPDLAAALRELLAWAEMMGGWDAPCWAEARRVLDHATTCDPRNRDAKFVANNPTTGKRRSAP